MLYKEWLDKGGNKLPEFIENWILLLMKTKDRSSLLNLSLEDIFKFERAGESAFREMKKFVSQKDEDDAFIAPKYMVDYIESITSIYGQVLKRVVGK